MLELIEQVFFRYSLFRFDFYLVNYVETALAFGVGYGDVSGEYRGCVETNRVIGIKSQKTNTV